MATGSQERTENDQIGDMDRRKTFFGLTLTETYWPKIEIKIMIPNFT